MRRVRRSGLGTAALVAAVTAALLACGSSASTPGPAVVGSFEGGSAQDASAEERPIADAAPERFTAEVDASEAGTCLPEDICFEAESGTATMHYRVHLPGIPASERFVVPHFDDGKLGVNLFVKRTLIHDYVDVYVRLQPGDFKVGFGIDNNGDGDDLDPGDDYGWFEGTVQSPNQSEAAATLVTVVSSSFVEFGIGPRP